VVNLHKSYVRSSRGAVEQQQQCAGAKGDRGVETRVPARRNVGDQGLADSPRRWLTSIVALLREKADIGRPLQKRGQDSFSQIEKQVSLRL
jgi:hypothetical protein